MSSNTSTPAALSSDAHSLAGTCWRLVEAQHHVSTLKLVDSVDEQELLEDLIEATKPPVPPECRDLHYLLSTPFRYGTVYPTGSRFRRAGLTEGVFYASEKPETAVAEMAFYRLLFFAEIAQYTLAGKPCRVHGILSRICNQESNRSDQGQISSWHGTVDAPHRLHSLSGVRRDGSRCQDRGHSLYIGSGSRAWHQSRLAHLPRFHETQSYRSADMAHSCQRNWCPGDLRDAKIRHHIQPSELCVRPAYREVAVDPSLEVRTESSANLPRSSAVADNQPCSGRAQLRFT